MNGILVTYGIIVLALAIGWISNLITVIGFIGTGIATWTGIQMLEVAGIVIVPLGAVLGVIGWF